mmetsp:Transcript_57447/g.136581  ORF Transcript_57447/g.136581 Transcript_57447/m.136581 type:complete len:241 (-) Transcript_57447:131-853(-)
MAKWDPAGVAVAIDAAQEAAEDARLRTSAHGLVMLESALEKAAPELFTEMVFAGSMGSGVGGGGTRPIYKVKRKDGEILGMVDADGNPIQSTVAKAGEELGKKGEQKFKRTEFGWRKLYHALQGIITQTPGTNSFFMEVAFTATTLRLYTDHRVMGAIVIPGVSHVALMASTGLMGFQSQFAKDTDHATVKEVLFERPYVIHEGLEIINGPPEALPQEQTYCRATSVARESGAIKAVFSS